MYVAIFLMCLLIILYGGVHTSEYHVRLGLLISIVFGAVWVATDYNSERAKIKHSHDLKSSKNIKPLTTKMLHPKDTGLMTSKGQSTDNQKSNNIITSYRDVPPEYTSRLTRGKTYRVQLKSRLKSIEAKINEAAHLVEVFTLRKSTKARIRATEKLLKLKANKIKTKGKIQKIEELIDIIEVELALSLNDPTQDHSQNNDIIISLQTLDSVLSEMNP